MAVASRVPSVLDAHLLDPWWESELGRRQGPVFDCLHGLTERFVDQVVLTEPERFGELGRGPVLFLSSQQVGLDGLLLPWICSSLLGAPVRTLLPEDRKGSWLGWMQGLLQSRPAAKNPDLLHFAPMKRPAELASSLEIQADWMRGESRALLIPAQRERPVVAGQPVRRLPSAILELALALDAPVVPIRCVHGLPLQPGREPLEFPVGLGRQSFFIGPPISPVLLRSLPLKERKDFVLDALHGLGPDLEHDRPMGAEPDFESTVHKWLERREAKGNPVSLEGAILRQVLSACPDPSPETQRLLDCIESDQVLEVTGPLDLWLLELGRRLAGWP